MLHLEKVNGNNVWDILKLTVSESQKNFVATNEISIIEAYTAITGNGHAFPFGIYDEDKPVGFLMIGFDVDDYWTDAPEIAKENYNLWRLMIDKAYQNRGYGKEAVSLALEFIKSMPCGEAEYCWLSYEPDNAVARQMYRSFGFEETGEMDGEELIAVLRLQLTTSSLRLEVSLRSSSSFSSVRALLILPSSDASPITVATIYASPLVTTDPINTLCAEE